MLKILSLFFLALLPTMAETETFDKKFTVTFPGGWKKPETPRKGTIVYRESGDKDASFAIAKLTLPKNSKANLTATVKSMTDGMKKTLKFAEEPKNTKGKVDGKDAVFTRVITVSKEGAKTGFFIIAVDAGDRVFMMQATIPNAASKKSRADCMKIIKSFTEVRK